MQQGQLTFSNTPILGERLPVEDIKQTNAALDQQYQINSAQLDQVQNSLNQIQVRDYDSPYLEQKKTETLQAINDLKNSGNLQAAGKNIKGIVSNLTNDDTLKNAISSYQTEQATKAELQERVKKYYDSGGKDGISPEQYEIATLNNLYANTSPISVNETGNYVGHFHATGVPSHVEVLSELEDAFTKIKGTEGSILASNMADTLAGSLDPDMKALAESIKAKIASAGRIDASFFNGIGQDRLLRMAQLVLKSDKVKAYTNFMADGATLKLFANLGSNGLPILDVTGTPIYKQYTKGNPNIPNDPNDINRLLAPLDLSFNDSDGVPEIGHNEQHLIDKYGNDITKFGDVNGVTKKHSSNYDANGTHLETVFHGYDWYNGNVVNPTDPTGFNQSALQDSIRSLNHKTYEQFGMDFAASHAYWKLEEHDMANLYLEKQLEGKMLKSLVNENSEQPDYTKLRPVKNDPNSAFQYLSDNIRDYTYTSGPINNVLHTLGIAPSTTFTDKLNKAVGLNKDVLNDNDVRRAYVNASSIVDNSHPKNKQLFSNYLNKQGYSWDAIKTLTNTSGKVDSNLKANFENLWGDFVRTGKQNDETDIKGMVLNPEAEKDLKNLIVTSRVEGEGNKKKEIASFIGNPTLSVIEADGKGFDINNSSATYQGKAQDFYNDFKGRVTIADPFSTIKYDPIDKCYKAAIVFNSEDGKTTAMVADPTIKNKRLDGNYQLLYALNGKQPLQNTGIGDVHSGIIARIQISDAKSGATREIKTIAKINPNPTSNANVYLATPVDDSNKPIGNTIELSPDQLLANTNTCSTLGNVYRRANLNKGGGNFVQQYIKTHSTTDSKDNSSITTYKYNR